MYFYYFIMIFPSPRSVRRAAYAPRPLLLAGAAHWLARGCSCSAKSCIAH